MTNQEKRDLANMVRRGLTVEQIIKRTTAMKATVKRYIKALRPTDFPASLDKTEVTDAPPKSGFVIGESAGNSDQRP